MLITLACCRHCVWLWTLLHSCHSLSVRCTTCVPSSDLQPVNPLYLKSGYRSMAPLVDLSHPKSGTVYINGKLKLFEDLGGEQMADTVRYLVRHILVNTDAPTKVQNTCIPPVAPLLYFDSDTHTNINGTKQNLTNVDNWSHGSCLQD